MPSAYCQLLSARSLEQQGAQSEARMIYKRLTQTAKLPNNALAGLIRTETFPDTEIPATAREAHPDYLGATCAQMIKFAPNRLFRTVASNCSEKLADSSEILAEIAQREWMFGLKDIAIRRLETHLQADPLDHRIRAQLAFYLYDVKALRSAIDHSQTLVKYRSATNPLKLKLVSALIQTRQFSQAKTIFDVFAHTLSETQKEQVRLRFEANKGACNELSALNHLSPQFTLTVLEENIRVLKDSPCAVRIEDMLLNALKDVPENAQLWAKLIEYYMQSNQYELGRKTLSEVLPKFGQSAELAYLGAQMQYNKGHYELAANLIEEGKNPKSRRT